MNRKQKKKKTVWQQYIAMAFFILLGAVCGILAVKYISEENADRPFYAEMLSLIGFFIGLYAAIFIQMIIHEAGHLVFGLLSGYKFSSFRIFSFMFVKENDKIQFRRLSIAGTGGQCLMTPPDMVNGKIPVVLYNLGGSIMNVIAGLIFLCLFYTFAKIPFLSTVMLLFSASGFILAVMNGVPMRMGTVDNDGYNAFALTRNLEAERAFWIQMKVNEQTAKGIRLKNMPEEWFSLPSDEAMKNSMVAAVGVFACNRLMDSMQFEKADKLMEHILELDSGMVGLHRNLIICDRIYVELITENRREILSGFLTREQKKFMKTMKKFPSVLRTEYVYALLSDRDSIKADNIREQFEKAAKTYPYQNDIQAERELMELAKKKFDKAY